MSKPIFHKKYEDVYGRAPVHLTQKHVAIYEAVKPKFQIGDIVKVFNGGYMYSNYTAMALALGLITERVENWSCAFKDDIGFVAAVALHENKEENVYAIRESNGNQFLIGEKGLRLVEKGSHLDKELFEI